jgi:hypothetical protein
MTQYLTEQNITTAVLICSALCTVASGLLQLLGKTTASNFVGALPTTLHLGPVVSLLLDWAKRNRELASKLTKVSIAFLVLGMSGCAGTLEDSRGRISPALTLPRTVEVSKRCQSLSDQNKWFKVGAATSGVLAGSSGLTAWPVQDGDVERALFISAGVLGVAATGLTLLQAETASQYVAEGCAK